MVGVVVMMVKVVIDDGWGSVVVVVMMVKVVTGDGWGCVTAVVVMVVLYTVSVVVKCKILVASLPTSRRSRKWFCTA